MIISIPTLLQKFNKKTGYSVDSQLEAQFYYGEGREGSSFEDATDPYTEILKKQCATFTSSSAQHVYRSNPTFYSQDKSIQCRNWLIKKGREIGLLVYEGLKEAMAGNYSSVKDKNLQELRNIDFMERFKFDIPSMNGDSTTEEWAEELYKGLDDPESYINKQFEKFEKEFRSQYCPETMKEEAKASVQEVKEVKNEVTKTAPKATNKVSRLAPKDFNEEEWEEETIHDELDAEVAKIAEGNTQKADEVVETSVNPKVSIDNYIEAPHLTSDAFDEERSAYLSEILYEEISEEVTAGIIDFSAAKKHEEESLIIAKIMHDDFAQPENKDEVKSQYLIDGEWRSGIQSAHYMIERLHLIPALKALLIEKIDDKKPLTDSERYELAKAFKAKYPNMEIFSTRFDFITPETFSEIVGYKKRINKNAPTEVVVESAQHLSVNDALACTILADNNVKVIEKIKNDPIMPKDDALFLALSQKVKTEDVYRSMELLVQNTSGSVAKKAGVADKKHVSDFKKNLLAFQLKNVAGMTEWQYELRNGESIGMPDVITEEQVNKNICLGIQHIIEYTKWDIGFFGGEKSGTGNAIPKNMLAILIEIDLANKEQKTWSDALVKIKEIANNALEPENSPNSFFAFFAKRGETTTQLYNYLSNIQINPELTSRAVAGSSTKLV